MDQEKSSTKTPEQSNLALLSQIATSTVKSEPQDAASDVSSDGYLNKHSRRQSLLLKKQQEQQRLEAQRQAQQQLKTQQQQQQQTSKKTTIKKSANSSESENNDSETDTKPLNKKSSKKPVAEDSNDSNDDESEENILNSIEVEYESLSSACNMRKENLCAVCEMPGYLLECQGVCMQAFHLDCIGLTSEPTREVPFKCEECLSNNHSCFICKKAASSENPTRKCSSSACGKFFHDDCTHTSELFRREPNNKSFMCPLHACLTCFAEYRSAHSQSCSQNDDQNSSTSASSTNTKPVKNTAINNQAYNNASKGRFMRCIRCPTAYHVGDYCIAAGSVQLAGYNIICPNHFQPIKNNSQHNRMNVTWCFVCCKGGELVGCSKCPAGYHASCLENPPAPGTGTPNSPHATWVCDDCERGRRPLYGEIVWVKVGVYRWWPAQICHPKNVPKNLVEKPHQVGEFAVRFFGSNDYFWITNGRCFAFAEEDECGRNRNIQKGLAISFQKGVQQAKAAFKLIQKIKTQKSNRSSGRDNMRNAKYNFQFIKTSKPVGNMVVAKVPLSDLPRCDCDPKSANPCGTDDCLNRMLKYECHPATCPAGTRCQNQRFVKRQYPRQEPFKTSFRGWGLKNMVDIKKGEFVNEYVGELIDDEECKRRLELAHENDITNFYFLTIEKDRIIDAGPKGNFSRFMNHSCDPNIETQKWIVNGDVRVGLFAVADIPAGTELTFNYNLDCLSNERAICKCGAKTCSGFIGTRPKNANGVVSNDKKSQKKKK